MTIAFVAERADTTATAAGSSLNVPMAAGGSITVGNTLIMSIASRDVATPPVNPQIYVGNFNMTDVRGNLWRRITTSANAGATAAADDGAVISLWVCHVVFPYVNGDNIVLLAPITSRPMTHVAARIVEFSGVRRVSSAIDLGTPNTGNGTASTVTGIQPTVAGQLVYASVAVANNPTLTGDADTTDGSWAAIDQAVSGATGITRGDQYKIVTGTSAQTWDTTWTGTQRWAAAALVMEVASTSWPLDSEYLANPGFPCPAGPEILPVTRTTTPVDTGTAYLFDTNIPPESLGASSIYIQSRLSPPRDDVDTQHNIVTEVYETGDELIRTEPFIYTLGTPYNAVLSTTPLSDPPSVVGGGTATAALASPGGTYLFLPSVAGDNSYVDCYFDASALLPLQDSHRILNIRISYVAWKDDSASAEPGEGLAVRWRDLQIYNASASEGATRLHGVWLVNDYRSTARRAYRNLGELNGAPRFGNGTGQMYENFQACWTIRDLLHMGAGDATAMFRLESIGGSFPSQQQIYLDTVRLDVFIVPEERLANSARRVTSGVGFPGTLSATGGAAALPLLDTHNTSNPWQVPSTQTDLTIAVREAVPATGSDWYSAQSDPDALANNFNNQRYATQEPVGPSLVMQSIVQPRETLAPSPSVRRVEWSSGQIAPNAETEEYGELIQSIAPINLNSYQAWWPYYAADNFLNEGASSTVTAMQLIGVDGATSYDYLKVLIKPSPNTVGTLDFSVEQPTSTVLATATVSVADALASPDVGNGFREMHLPLSTTITPAAGTVEVYALSTTPDSAPWILAYAFSDSGRFQYDPTPLTTPGATVDLAIALCCPLEPIEASIESGTVSNNDSGTNCALTSTNIPCITIENAQEYDWISVERYVSEIDRTPVALIPGTLGQGEELFAQDTFGRVIVDNWGTMDTGQTWTASTPADFDVNSGRGVITAAVANTQRVASIPATNNDYVAQATFDIPAVPTGASIQAHLHLRSETASGLTTADDVYAAVLEFATNGRALLQLQKVAGGAASAISSVYTVAGPGGYIPGTGVTVRFQVVGNTLRASAWLGDDDPGDNVWFLNVTDTSVPTGGFARVQYARISGNTSPDPALYVDSYSLSEFVAVPVEWCDYGVPWDLPAGEVSYVLHGFRDNDRRQTDPEQVIWNDSSVNPGAAFGLATEDALYVYVPVSDSGELEIEWNNLNPIDQLPLAGKDYQVALRIPEDRGMSVTVNVIVQRLTRCGLPVDMTAIYDQSTYDNGYVYS